jgi:hypothetical protein
VYIIQLKVVYIILERILPLPPWFNNDRMVFIVSGGYVDNIDILFFILRVWDRQMK